MSASGAARTNGCSLLARARATRASLFHYDLPPSRIASRPLQDRSSSKLLLFDRGRANLDGGVVSHHRFHDLPHLVPSNATLVMNDSRVIPARLPMHKKTGGKAEVFLLSPHDFVDPSESLLKPLGNGITWNCFIGGRRIQQGDVLTANHGSVAIRACVSARSGACAQVSLTADPRSISLGEALKYLGKTPLPPYIKREADDLDTETYQTVYADKHGSVAAPTAGLHITQDVMNSLSAKGIRMNSVTLHVGAGTFAQMGGPTAADHEMHEEQFSVGVSTLRSIAEDWRAKRPIIAVVSTCKFCNKLVIIIIYLLDTYEIINSMDGSIDSITGFFASNYRCKSCGYFLRLFFLSSSVSCRRFLKNNVMKRIFFMADSL